MSLARRTSNLVLAIGQAVVPALGYAGLFGKTVGAEFQTTITPVVPAGYAFAIWALIFLLCLIYALDQARPSRADDPLYRRIGWLTAAAFGANMVWSMVAQKQLPLVLTGLVFLATVATALPAAARAFEQSDDGDRRYLAARLALGVLAAWVSVAIWANWSVVLEDLGLGDVPRRDLQALVFLSGAGATAAFMVIWTRGALAYSVTIAWALIALIVANLQRNEPAVAVGAGLWLGALGVLTCAVRSRWTNDRALSRAAA